MPVWFTPDPKLVDVAYMVATVILPIVVALIAKSTWSAARRGWLLAFCAAVLGFAQVITENPDGFDLWKASLASITTFVVAVAVHFGLWRAETSEGVSVSSKAKAAIW